MSHCTSITFKHLVFFQWMRIVLTEASSPTSRTYLVQQTWRIQRINKAGIVKRVYRRVPLNSPVMLLINVLHCLPLGEIIHSLIYSLHFKQCANYGSFNTKCAFKMFLLGQSTIKGPSNLLELTWSQIWSQSDAARRLIIIILYVWY